MLLKSIRLENIRSYTNQEVNFPEGSLLLWGDIGSGKSTILSAVEFALFGIIRGQLSGGALLRHGSNTGSVELKMDIDKKEVVIKRALKRNKSNILQDAGYIIVDGKKLDASAQEIRAKVLDLLQYPKELLTESKSLIYRYTVYTPQEQMKQILYDKVEDRLNILRKVFGIDKYKRVKENGAVIIKAIKDRKIVLSELTKDFRQKEIDMKAKEQEIISLQARRQDLKPKIEEVRRSISLSRTSIEIAEANVRKADLVRSSIQSKDTMLKEYARQVMENNDRVQMIQEEMKILDDALKDHPKVSEDSINELDSKIKKMIEKRSGIKQKIELYSRQLPMLEKEIRKKTEDLETMMMKKEELELLQKEAWGREDIEQKVKRLEKEIEDLKMALNEARLGMKQSEMMKQKISSMKDCPTCRQEVSGSHKKIIDEEESAKISRLSKTIESNLKPLEQKQISLEDLKKQLQKIVQKEMAIEKLKGEVSSFDQLKIWIVEKQKEYSRMDIERINLEKEQPAEDLAAMGEELKRKRSIFTMQQQLDEKKKISDEIARKKEDLKASIGRLNEEKRLLSKDLDSMKDAEQSYKMQRQAHEVLLSTERELAIKDASIEKEIEGVKKLKQAIDQEILRQKVHKDDLQKLERLHEWLDTQFIGIIDVMEKHVMTRIYKEFNALFQQWFSILMEDDSISVRLDDEFTPIIEQNGYETFLENLSGGEKTALALSYRLSLNKVINDVISGIKTKDIIILDEPTDGFSSDQLDKIRDVLQELNVKQTVIVSHENKIESFVDKILKVNKSGHVSQII